jgi:hypothetical protein
MYRGAEDIVLERFARDGTSLGDVTITLDADPEESASRRFVYSYHPPATAAKNAE